jgi:hypothetical protein
MLLAKLFLQRSELLFYKYINMKEVKCDFLKIDDSDLNLNHVIRIGAVRDGGYFVTKRLIEEADFLISGGISYNVAFEKDFWDINRTAKLIMIDGSFNFFTYIARPFLLDAF